MKLIPVNCPRCNSRQRFAPHLRVVGGSIVKYVRCRMCHHELIVDMGKPRRRRRAGVPEVR